MTTNYKSVLLLVVGMTFAGPVLAHDPSHHGAKNDAPKCDTMKDMKGMSSDNPVMLAMMSQCADADAKQTADHEHDAEGHVDSSDPDHAAQHHHHDDE